MPIVQSRRRFLTNAALAGAAGLVGARAAGLGGGGKSLAAEPPPEIRTIRSKKDAAICEAPRYVAGQLLRAEGFNDVDYTDVSGPLANSMEMVARGKLDYSFQFAPQLIRAIDAGKPITVLAGVHVGCFELFGSERISGVADLKGKSVATGVAGLTTDLVTIMASYVGLDPAKDIHWVTNSSAPMQLFLEGQVDAFLAIPVEPQKLRARKIGRVIVNSAIDRPWSQYFCCMLYSSAEFIRKYPVATKRILRAVLKATDLCASEPERVARAMVAGGFADDYDYTLQMLTEIPYGLWRDYDPEDTVRWFALRMHEAGMIKSSPQKIVANGTDWRFLNEVKRELKV
jgi:NitT/TauT family transport system substrate-binding protein